MVGLLPAGAQTQKAVQAWAQRYNGPGNGDDAIQSVAVDTNGNVYVAGYSKGISSDLDYATLKYSAAGVPLWTNRYNGPGNGEDGAQSVAVDTAGNVYVTGAGIGTVPPDYDYATIKYSSAGVPLWTNWYNGPGNGSDQAYALALDAEGNVYVTGDSWSTNSAGTEDYATLKYSSAGLPLWTNRYGGPGNGSDGARAIALDAGGNVYVTGGSLGNRTGQDYATIKYSTDGVPLWTNRYNGPGNLDDYATGIAVDTNGDVIVTGYSLGGGGYFDYATLKYSSDGAPLWTNRYGGPDHVDHYARAVKVDPRNSVVVTGQMGRAGGGSAYATVAYSSAGTPLWTNLYSGSDTDWNGPSALAVDADGNVYVTGRGFGSGGGQDCATIAYSAAGVPLWTNLYNGPANDWDGASAVAVDAGGNVYVAGYSLGIGSGFDFVTIKYVPVGPALGITTAGSQVRIAWPATATAWVLRRASAAGGPYLDPGLAITSEGGERVAYDSLGAGTRFYRLQKQP